MTFIFVKMNLYGGEICNQILSKYQTGWEQKEKKKKIMTHIVKYDSLSRRKKVGFSDFFHNILTLCP